MVSFDKSDSFDDASDDDGSDSVSAGTCGFTFCFDESIGRVIGIGSGIFHPTGIESFGDIFCWSCSYQKEPSSKVVDS